MASPRTVLLEAFRDCLARIQVAAGYNTNAGSAVTLEPAPHLHSEAAFIAPVWARQQRATQAAIERTHRLTTVDVVAKVPAALANAQEVLDAIVADIEQAMDEQQFRFPHRYEFPKYQSAEPLAANVTAGWIGAVVTYTSHIPIKPTA